MDQGWDKGIGRVVDVLGFNYRTNQIEAYHQRHPDQPVFGSETGSTVRRAANMPTTDAPHRARLRHRASVVGDHRRGMVDHRRRAPAHRRRLRLDRLRLSRRADALRWFPSISSHFGILDTCGFPKDNSYYYRAWWRPDQPLVHLLPHWTWPGREGQPIAVWAHGNSEEVELRLNGRSLGRKAMPRNRHLEWRVPYAPGPLEAVGYDGGRGVARGARDHRAGAFAHAPRTAHREGGDVVIVTPPRPRRARAPGADRRQSAPVQRRRGEVIGVGNGNPNSLEPDSASERRAFNGLAQAIVRFARGPVDYRSRARA